MARQQRKRGKQQFSKRQREVESEDMKKHPDAPNMRDTNDCHKSTPNDWRWYAQSPQLVKDYASFPFGARIGNQLQTGVTITDRNSIPGIFRVDFYPSFGYAAEENDPINVAMRKVYSFVRYANSGASNYDAPDLMLYLGAVDSALMFLEYLKRIYGVMRNYNPFNVYWPKAVVTAMNVNYDSISANLNDFRGFINQYVMKLSQLWIPNSMSYMARHAWMCSGIYGDGTSPKAQTYFYNPLGFYRFALNQQSQVGMLVMDPLNAGVTSMTYEFLVNYGNSLINPLIATEDFGIMGGDILKAFGASGVYSPAMITEDYQVLPIYSQEVLSQIENSTAVPIAYQSLNVTQAVEIGTGYLVTKPRMAFVQDIEDLDTVQMGDEIGSFLNSQWTARRILNFHHTDVGPEDVIVATRLMNIPSEMEYARTASGFVLQGNLKTASSEIVTRYRMFWFHFSDGGEMTLNSNTCYSVNVGYIPKVDSEGGTFKEVYSTDTSVQYTIPLLSYFDWHPIVYQNITVPQGEQLSCFPARLPIFDADWVTYIDSVNLLNMSRIALLSELTVPQIS